jgi:FkbM family methyltransferase
VKHLVEFVNNPWDPDVCYNLAKEYFELGQWAGAQSFFSRCAERTYDDEKAYECLLYMGKCFYYNTERNESARQCVLHAIALKPERPEGYYFQGLYMASCIHDYWQDVYTNSCTGIEMMKSNPPKLFKEEVEQGLWFNKAWSAYYVNRIRESHDLFTYINLKFDVIPELKQYVDNNIFNNRLDCNFTQLGNERKVAKEIDDQVLIERIYERELCVNKGEIVVDIGANVGAFSYSILKRKPKKIYCLEPSKKLHEALKLNLDKSNVKIIGKGISNNFTFEKDAYGNGSDSEFITFKQFIEDNKIKKIDFLKVDCEGGEYDIFTKENVDWITKNVSKIVCEFHLWGVEGWYENFKIFRDLYLPSAKFYKAVYVRDNDDTSQKILDDNWLQTFSDWAMHGGQLIISIDFKEKQEEKEKLDIVIQGKYNDYVDELINHYQQLYFVNNIIVSCWNGDKEPSAREGVKFKFSPLPEDPGTGNRNLQIKSSYEGLKCAKTKYAIKVRSDQKYSYNCMLQMYNFFIDNKERDLSYWPNNKMPRNSIITGGIFSPFPFHPRDHIFFGNTEDLIELFDIPHETPNFTKKYGIAKQFESNHYDKHIRTESYIGTHYCAKFNTKLKDFLKDPELYLHDGAKNIDQVLEISNEITHKIFKPVPSRILEIEWPKYNWQEYQISSQRDQFGEKWEEDFKEG